MSKDTAGHAGLRAGFYESGTLHTMASFDQRDLGIGYSERCDRFLQGYDVFDANFRKSSVAKDLSGQLGWHPGGD